MHHCGMFGQTAMLSTKPVDKTHLWHRECPRRGRAQQVDDCALSPGFWADREALQPGGLARLLMWAALRGPDGGNLPLKLLQVHLMVAHGYVAMLMYCDAFTAARHVLAAYQILCACLQDVLLTIMFTDCDGVDSRQTFRDIKLPGAAQVSCESSIL